MYVYAHQKKKAIEKTNQIANKIVNVSNATASNFISKFILMIEQKISFFQQFEKFIKTSIFQQNSFVHRQLYELISSYYQFQSLYSFYTFYHMFLFSSFFFSYMISFSTLHLLSSFSLFHLLSFLSFFSSIFQKVVSSFFQKIVSFFFSKIFSLFFSKISFFFSKNFFFAFFIFLISFRIFTT